ncbi:Methyltransferase domain-containing protein [Frankineae bacterium MT45]|nr:Methyltransferase domain-containing protein [Frankineae bacterium MT45]
MKLNLGSGWDNRDGYINVDFLAVHQPDVVADVFKLPFASHSVSEVFGQDVLEHLPRTATGDALAEWRRVTRDGGVARIRVPSLFHAADLMQRTDTLEMHELLLQNLYGTQAYTGDIHLTSFTDRTIAAAFHAAGFRMVTAELVDQWMWDITAVGADGPPLALFWDSGFYVEESSSPVGSTPSGEPTRWRWCDRDGSISLVNTGDTRLRASLTFELVAPHAPGAAVTVRIGVEGRSAPVGEPITIDFDVEAGQRLVIDLHAPFDQLDAPADARKLYFQTQHVALTAQPASGGSPPTLNGMEFISDVAESSTDPAQPPAELPTPQASGPEKRSRRALKRIAARLP